MTSSSVIEPLTNRARGSRSATSRFSSRPEYVSASRKNDLVVAEPLGVVQDHLAQSRANEPRRSSYHNAHEEPWPLSRRLKTPILMG